MMYQITEIQFDFDDDEYTPDVKEIGRAHV